MCKHKDELTRTQGMRNHRTGREEGETPVMKMCRVLPPPTRCWSTCHMHPNTEREREGERERERERGLRRGEGNGRGETSDTPERASDCAGPSRRWSVKDSKQQVFCRLALTLAFDIAY